VNFLAHLLLSDDFGPVMVGNFMGDFVKGKQVEQYPPAVQRGIWLHRTIDQFTDTHAVVRQSKERLRPRFRHYAGVVSDMFYDHYLAVSWEQYGPNTLEEFTQKAYQVLQGARKQMPTRAQFMLPYMIQHDWLVSYREIEGIRRSLTGMARRTGFRSGMEHAHEELKEQYEAYANDFHAFFPDLVQHAKQFLLNG